MTTSRGFYNFFLVTEEAPFYLFLSIKYRTYVLHTIYVQETDLKQKTYNDYLLKNQDRLGALLTFKKSY